MRALGIVGSYRTGGVTDTTVTRVLEGAASVGAETEKIMLTSQRLEYCTNCRTCAQQPGDVPASCRHGDDMAGLIRKGLEAEVLVLGSPVNFGSVTAITRTFIERLAPLYQWPWGTAMPRRRKLPGRRKAVLVTSAAAPELGGRQGNAHAMKSLKIMADAFDARVVGQLYLGRMALQPQGSLTDSDRKAAYQAGIHAVKAKPRGLQERLKDLAGAGMEAAGVDPMGLLDKFISRR
jgi:multimeric flavodoxin WrbA